LQPYGTADQAIRSIGRESLNLALLAEAEASTSGRVTIKFNYSLKELDKDGNCVFEDKKSKAKHCIKNPKVVIGADGAYSTVRDYLARFARADFSRRYIRHCYKEISLPATSKGDYALPVRDMT
jgi:kynurenine 3-monooxygenase